jgi:glycosyltransferase involved in cell wall biosynthesis
MLGLAQALGQDCRSTFISFAESGFAAALVTQTRCQGFEAHMLRFDTPRLWSAFRELSHRLVEENPDLICCHGYKANLLGRLAARRAGIPIVSVVRGWTGEDWKVRLYERLDRLTLRWMDQVVCVSKAQVEFVLAAKVAPERVTVIRNAIHCSRFNRPDAAYRKKIEMLFSARPARIVGAAGRLSPEKGFDVLVRAAQLVRQKRPDVGFVVFGDGPLAKSLQEQASRLGIADGFVLAGFREDLDQFMPHLDVLAVPSHAEGLPNVALEAHAAAVPIVATAVGGLPEIVDDQKTGFLVAPQDATAMADKLVNILECEERRSSMGEAGRKKVNREFSFDIQAALYLDLFEAVRSRSRMKGQTHAAMVTRSGGGESRLSAGCK